MHDLGTKRAVAAPCAPQSTKTRFVHAALLSIFVVSVWDLTSGVVRAQSLQESELEQQGLAAQSTSGGWNVNLGAGLSVQPTYEGSSTDHVRPVPLVSITYGDPSTHRNLFFISPSGLGVNLLNWNGFRAGPVLGFEEGRDQSDDVHLNGLGDIQPSITAGIFGAYRVGPFELSGTVRQAITHTSNGLVGLVRLNYRGTIIPQKLDFIVGPNLELTNSQYARTWFGITSDQSVQSGLPVYTPGAGLKDVGLDASLTYHYSEHILLRTFANVKELTGNIADSPIVQNKTQVLVGIGAAYHF